MNKGLLNGWQILDRYAERSVDLGAINNGRAVINYGQANNWALTTSISAVTVEVREWPPVGQTAVLMIEWTGSNAITWPSTWKWLTDTNAAPATPGAGLKKFITAVTRDGGATVWASSSAVST